ncbi:MAG: 1-deoxy-D-xylulose-5-phosphate synthase [Chlamydiae bacterium]|nr:1-deoxy-D-xylulose-5-phosphate synthase [Chlamydiota bacterium]
MLAKIKCPKDIQKYSIEELDQLAFEIRQRIINVLSVNGGHLASNLGIVELTIALHYVFNAPSDKLIFDVSHQTYTHKLLTGRNENFEGIRRYKGLCGFSDPQESTYDHFYAGHAGTALSLALGSSKNREMFGRDEYIVPIIGDATLTCGMVLEALNNLPQDLKRFIVVLNDNAMSISNNVGAITNILGKIIGSPLINKLRAENGERSYLAHVDRGLQTKTISSVGGVDSPSAFFEQYGLNYIGPIDGHDIKKLIQKLTALKKEPGPCLIHVVTTKGKGMPEAISNPITHHGAKPFNPDSGKFLPNPTAKPTFPKIFGKHILKIAEQDSSVIAVTPAMAHGSCLDAFRDTFPNRCIDVGIAESHSVTYCGGIAKGGGLKVVASIYATFLQRAFDNLFHDVCLQKSPVVFAIDRAGLSPADGCTHHGVYDIAFLKVMPNMVVCQPRDGRLLKELMNVAFDWKKPTAIRYPNMITEGDDATLQKRELGKGEVLVKGQGLLIIALGHMNTEALLVHEMLLEKGIESTVFDPIFIKPLDEEKLHELLENHSMLVTIEEHSLQGGLGNTINQFLMQNNRGDVQVLNKGIPDVYLQQGGRADLLKEIGLLPEQIAESIIENFSLKPTQLATL